MDHDARLREDGERVEKQGGGVGEMESGREEVREKKREREGSDREDGEREREGGREVFDRETYKG